MQRRREISEHLQQNFYSDHRYTKEESADTSALFNTNLATFLRIKDMITSPKANDCMF